MCISYLPWNSDKPGKSLRRPSLTDHCCAHHHPHGCLILFFVCSIYSMAFKTGSQMRGCTSAVLAMVSVLLASSPVLAEGYGVVYGNCVERQQGYRFDRLLIR